MSDFQNKKILFIGPKFFGYETEIKKRLEEWGATVDYFDDRPSIHPLIKAAIRLNRNLIASYLYSYQNEFLLQTKHKNYDYVFVLKGEALLRRSIDQIKQSHPQAKLILYLWDSIKNNRYIEESLNCFDSAFTFDNDDAQALPKLKLRPLFYLNAYKGLPSTNVDTDLLFLGTVHGDRYRVIQKIRAELDSDTKSYFFMFFSSRLLFWARRIFEPVFWRARSSEFSFTPLGKPQVFALITKAIALLDINARDQSGLTMRTLEALGAKKKLVTTNAQVRDYDFFDERNILIVDRERPLIPSLFFKTPYVPLPENIYEKYSLDAWLQEVFS